MHDFHGVEPTGKLHEKLRVCMFEMLTIEAEVKDAKAEVEGVKNDG